MLDFGKECCCVQLSATDQLMREVILNQTVQSAKEAVSAVGKESATMQT